MDWCIRAALGGLDTWVAVRVIRTDEAQMIVRSVIRVLGLG